MHIAIFTGTRADWGLLKPLADALRAAGCRVSVIACNMHLDPTLGDTLSEIRADGYEPEALIAPGCDTASTLGATAAEGARALRRLRPEAAIILGDRYEMLGAASAALLSAVPLVHIAGGTVSEGAIDNSIRNAISQLATLHLCETPACADRLRSMGLPPEAIVTTGAIGVHNFLHGETMPQAELETSIDFPLDRHTILATLHAATLDTTSPQQQMRLFTEALADAMHADCQLRVLATYPNNDVDPAPQIALLEELAARFPERVRVIPSLGRVRYLSTLRCVGAVAGNSSSGLVEVPSTGIPTLDIGSRQRGREHGPSVFHCAHTREEILRGLRYVLSPEAQAVAARRENPYARPDTLHLMTEAILSLSPKNEDTHSHPGPRRL